MSPRPGESTAGVGHVRPASGARVRIRAAQPADHAAVAEAILTAYLSGGHLAEDDGYRRELEDVAARAEVAEILVAELEEGDGPSVAGTVALAPPGSPLRETAREGEYEFRMLAVHPRFHRRGVARALLEAVIDRARSTEGAHAVALTTMESMVHAHRLYESAGFVRAPERDWTLREVFPNLPEGVDGGPYPVYVLALD